MGPSYRQSHLSFQVGLSPTKVSFLVSKAPFRSEKQGHYLTVVLLEHTTAGY